MKNFFVLSCAYLKSKIVPLSFVCLLGTSVLLVSCGGSETQEEVTPTDDVVTEEEDIVFAGEIAETSISDETYENLATGEKAVFDRYDISLADNEENALGVRAIHAGLIGDYRVMNRMCAQDEQQCPRTYMKITTPHTGTSTGSLIAPSEYSVQVLGFETTEVSPNEYQASAYENMPYRILAKKPGYLTDIVTWYHQGSVDGESESFEFLPIFIEPTATWELSSATVDFTYKDISITGQLISGRGITLYLYDYSYGDLLDLNHGIVLADSIQEGELYGPPALDRVTIIQAWRDGEIIDTNDLQVSTKNGPVEWRFDSARGLWFLTSS